MAFVNITPSQTDAKSPIDVQLMDVGLNQNLDDHEARILALEAGGGSGGGSSDPSQDPRYGAILAGFQTNDPKFWRRRYKPNQQILSNGEKLNTLEGFDPEGSDLSRWNNTDDGAVFSYATYAQAYLGYQLFLAKGKKWNFKVKKGENFFGIGYVRGYSDNVEIFIDGQTVTAFGGIVDENGSAQTNAFSTAGSVVSSPIKWYFGLDGKEHYITIYSNDSGSTTFSLDFIEVGYASKHGTYAVDRDIKVNAGRVNVRGSVASTTETSFTFDATTGYGRTDAIIADTAGTLSVLKGIEPAMTKCRPTSIAFSGSLTTLPVINTKFFPSSGFLLVTHPNGGHHIASYTAKTDTTIALHSFDSIIWQSKPKEDYTPLDGFTSTTNNDSKGDIMINLWATGGVEISSSNNKLDFSIIVNGVTTSHTATIPSGLYSADLMPLGLEIVKQMQSVKPLSNGEYFAEYNENAQRWTIGVKGSEISRIDYLFSTGSNAANSIRTALGFTATDLTTKTSYMGQNNIQSLAYKVFQKDNTFMTANDPRHQYNFADEGISTALLDSMKRQLGIGHFRTLTSNNPVIKIFPDPDATGISFSYLGWGGGIQTMAQIDYAGQYMVINTDTGADDTNDKARNIYTGFLSFPRGSHVISLHFMSSTGFELTTGTQQIVYIGSRQYFTKPKIEALTTSQAVIKSFDISPKQFFKTHYAADYSPQATFDNIDTITRTGSWTSSTGLFNNFYYQTSTVNDTLDITFTLAGDGGGIGIITSFLNTDTDKIEWYLVSGSSASETSSLITHTDTNGPDTGSYVGKELFRITGLPAGQYTLRAKNKVAARFVYDVITIIDTVAPDRGQTVSDLNNTGQAVSYPLNAIYYNVARDSAVMVPYYLDRSGINQGKAFINYQAGNMVNGFPSDDSNDVNNENFYFSLWGSNDTADDWGSFNFGKSIFLINYNFNTGYCQVVQPVIDGVNHGNTFSTRVNVKGGAGPTVLGNYYPVFSDHFLRYGTSMSNSTTLPISNTKGLRVGSTVILEADSQTTLKRVIATVTADTNITFTEAVSGFANYTTANNVRVKAYGFHNIKFENDDGNTIYLSAICFEPMDVLESNHETRRMGSNKIGEFSTIFFKGVSNGGDLYYPYFSDGRQASFLESTIDIIGYSSGTATYSLPSDLKNISVSAGTLDIKITSVRRY